MLWWSKASRAIAHAVLILLGAVVFALPLLAIVGAVFATGWMGWVPSGWTLDHLRTAALSGEDLAGLSVSIQTGMIASAISIGLGVIAAILSRKTPKWLATLTAGVFHIPVAVPSVAIGLGVLIVCNEPPHILGGRAGLVVVAHTVLVLAFAFDSVDAALQRIDPGLYGVAESLGASPARIFVTVTLPPLVPTLGGAAGLLSLAMGELGVMAMMYPPSWRTLPATIYGFAERGGTLLAAAATCILLLATVVALALPSRLYGRRPFVDRKFVSGVSPRRRSRLCRDLVRGSMPGCPREYCSDRDCVHRCSF